MNEQTVVGSSERFSELNSDELMEIWNRHDTYQYSGADFDYIKTTLEGRGFTIKPHEESKGTKLEGIGGWLILPAIALVVLSIAGIAAIVTGFQLYEDVPTDYEFIVTTEIIFNVFIILFALFVTYLFFTKKATTPKFYITLLVAKVVVEFIVVLMVLSVTGSGADGSYFTSSIIYAAIWIPYWRKSKRVKNTFTK